MSGFVFVVHTAVLARFRDNLVSVGFGLSRVKLVKIFLAIPARAEPVEAQSLPTLR